MACSAWPQGAAYDRPATLAEEGHIHADYPVAVKVVDDELAVVASIIENEQRRAMHPAEQIIGFRTLASEGERRSKSGFARHFTPRPARITSGFARP